MPSAVIRDFHYDAETDELTIWFVSGRVYVYADVPAAVAEGLASASSKGQYFNAHIREGYPFQEIAAG